MKEQESRTRTCPLCGVEYSGHQAISRTDNATQICADCGTRQALESLGVPGPQIEHIIDVIHEAGE